MKILLCSFYSPPYNSSGVVRVGQTVRVLQQMGHEVKLISGDNQGSNKDGPSALGLDITYVQWLDINKLARELFWEKGLKKATLEPKNHKFNIKSKIINKLKKLYFMVFATPDSQITWYRPAVRAGTKIIKSGFVPDVILASGVPVTGFLVAAKLSKLFDIPWAGDLRDSWSENKVRNSWALDRYLERKTLSTASALFTVSQFYVEMLAAKYDTLICEIRNAYCETEFSALQKPVINQSKKIISYSGDVYPKYMDANLLISAIADDPVLKDNFICKFYGENEELEHQLLNQPHEFVELYPRIPRHEILEMQAKSDVLLLLTWNDSNNPGLFTGKLFEYIGSAKPILATGYYQDVAIDLINDFGYGLGTGSIAEIKKFLHQVLEFTVQEDIYKNYQISREQHSRKNQVIKLENILQQIRSKKCVE